MYEDEDTDDESLEMNDEDHEEYEQDEIALVKRHLPNNTLKNLIIDIGEYDDEYNDIGNNLEEQKVKNQKTMNKEGKCLERCVQQFCIPEDDLGMFSNCVDKCKTFCL